MHDNWKIVGGDEDQVVCLVLIDDDKEEAESVRLCVTYKKTEANEERGKKLATDVQKVLDSYTALLGSVEQAREACPASCLKVFDRLLWTTQKVCGEDQHLVGPAVALGAAHILEELEREAAALNQRIDTLKQRNETLEFLVAQSP